MMLMDRRTRVEGINRIYQEAGRQREVDDKLTIRAAALAEFIKRLDAKLANLQDGESLFIETTIEIIRANGQMRGGSGAERNMPEYIEWRKAVFLRDGHTCQHCGAKGRLNAHHIKSWANHPALRFSVDNGITLCPDCHAQEHPHLRFVNY